MFDTKLGKYITNSKSVWNKMQWGKCELKKVLLLSFIYDFSKISNKF